MKQPLKLALPLAAVVRAAAAVPAGVAAEVERHTHVAVVLEAPALSGSQ